MADKSIVDLLRELETGVEPGRSVELSRPAGTDQVDALDAVQGNAGVSFAQRVREMEGLREQGIHTPTPIEADVASRQQYLQQELQKTAPGAQVGDPGLDEFWTRTDLGWSDTFLEKRKKWLDYYPDGDFIEVNEPVVEPGSREYGRGGKTILLRRNETEDFIEFDAGALEKFELLGDLADISADLPVAALQAIITGGGSLVTQLLGIAGGRVAGETVKEVMEWLRGYQLETFRENVSDTLIKTGIDVTGGAATTVISGPLNFARGASLFKMRPGAKEAQQAASAVGMKPLLPHQVASNPILQRIGQQSQATVSTINDYLHANEQAAVRTLSGLRDENALKIALGGEDMYRLHDEAIDQIRGAMNSPHATLTEGGEVLQRGIAEYEDFSRTVVNRAYESARLIEEPKFDLAPALQAAREVRSGLFGKGTSGKDVMIDPPDPMVEAQADILLKLDPRLPATKTPQGRVITATDQLNAIRSNLWALKQIGIGEGPEARARAAQASKLFAAVDYVLKDPKNAKPEFIKAWRGAQAEAKKRFDTLEKAIVIKASETETPAMMASRLAKPLQVDNLKTLQGMLPKDKWLSFRAAVLADFIAPHNINNLTKRLKSLDGPTADMLFSKGDRRVLAFVGRKVDRLNAAKIQETVTSEGNVANIVKGLINNPNAGGVREFVRLADQLPANDQRRRIIRAGIIEDVWNSVRTPRQGGDVIDGKLLKEKIAWLQSSGVNKLLTAQDKQVIAKFNDIALFLKVRTDAGTSLQAAETAANIRGFKADAFQTLLETVGTGRFMTSTIGQRILLGKGTDRWDFSNLRVMGALLAQEVADRNGTSVEDEMRDY
jgi:hypothetical protein